jgi:hypothetical protein
MTQLRQSLLFLLFSGHDRSHPLLLVSVEPFGVFQDVIEIEENRDAKHDGWNGLDEEQPLPAAQPVRP